MQIEGKNQAREGLKSDKTIDKILALKDSQDKELANILKLAYDKKIKVNLVSRNVLDKESITGKHQGIIAYTTDFEYSELEELLDNGGKPNFLLILDGIEDPHNLGAIIRTAEATGVHGIIVPKRRNASLTASAAKARRR